MADVKRSKRRCRDALLERIGLVESAIGVLPREPVFEAPFDPARDVRTLMKYMVRSGQGVQACKRVEPFLQPGKREILEFPGPMGARKAAAGRRERISIQQRSQAPTLGKCGVSVNLRARAHTCERRLSRRRSHHFATRARPAPQWRRRAHMTQITSGLPAAIACTARTDARDTA